MSIFSQVFGAAGFNTSENPPTQEFEVIPAGKYAVRIEEAEVAETKAKTGILVNVTLVITEGQYANRKLWDRMNIKNPSEIAERIGRGQLSSLCNAVGLPNCTDENQLKGRSCIANVKVKTPKNAADGSEPFNAISSYSPYGGSVTPPPAPPVAQSAPVPPLAAPQAGGVKPPWMK